MSVFSSFKTEIVLPNKFQWPESCKFVNVEKVNFWLDTDELYFNVDMPIPLPQNTAGKKEEKKHLWWKRLPATGLW